MTRKKNDILLKSAFEEAFADLLRFFFKDADELFDIPRGFQFMDKELSELFPELEKQGGTRFADMLVKVYATNGKEEWILIHLEIQEQHNKQFARRMYQYFYRIYDRYEVPVTALAVFTGNQKQEADNEYKYEFLGTELTYRYNAYHILEHTEAQLLEMDNPFALIMLAAQKALLMDRIPEQELSEQRLTIARALIFSKKYDSEQIRRFLYFLKTFIYIENPEISFKFDKEIDLLTGNKKAMGIIEAIKMITREEGIEEGMERGIEEGIERGIEKGIEKGQEQKSYEFVRNLLLSTDFDTARIASLVGVNESFIEQVRQELNR